MVTITKNLSFFLIWVSKIQPNYQTKLMMWIVCSFLIDCVIIFLLFFSPPFSPFFFASSLIVYMC